MTTMEWTTLAFGAGFVVGVVLREVGLVLFLVVRAHRRYRQRNNGLEDWSWTRTKEDHP